MKSLLIVFSLTLSLSSFAQEKVVITKALIGSASAPGHAVNSFKTMEGCVEFTKKSQTKLKEAGYKVYSSQCDKQHTPPGWEIEESYTSDIKFF